MSFSGEIWVLNKLADLANRCGVSPTIANVSMESHWNDDETKHHYALSVVDGNARNEQEQEACNRVAKLLGLDKTFSVQFPDLESVEEAVDKALALAPPGSCSGPLTTISMVHTKLLIVLFFKRFQAFS